jgi:hypothetical protein
MPYSRIPPYIIGILTAYFYILSKTEYTLSNLLLKKLNEAVTLRMLCYLLGLGMVLFMLYAQYYQGNYFTLHGRWLDMVNLVFSRSVFVLGIFIFCLPALAGKGRLLCMLSANKTMTVLSRLTYGVYLTHEGLMEFYLFSMHTGIYASYSELSLLFLSNVVMGYIAGSFCFFVVEGPVFALEDLFYGMIVF